MGPRGLSIAPIKYGVPKGELAVCNFEDSSGAAGKGTTIELLDPRGSSPSTFAQSSKIAGCDGVAYDPNGIYAAG